LPSDGIPEHHLGAGFPIGIGSRGVGDNVRPRSGRGELEGDRDTFDRSVARVAYGYHDGPSQGPGDAPALAIALDHFYGSRLAFAGKQQTVATTAGAGKESHNAEETERIAAGRHGFDSRDAPGEALKRLSVCHTKGSVGGRPCL
jgi:hypothetical protein